MADRNTGGEDGSNKDRQPREFLSGFTQARLLAENGAGELNV
jgi:hypothetical protein